MDEQHGGIGSVRDDGGNVIQFKYGEDGFDPMCLVKQEIGELSKPMDDFIKRGGWDVLPETAWADTWRNLAKTAFSSSVALVEKTPKYAARLPLDVRHLLHALIEKGSPAASPQPNGVTRALEVVFRGAMIFLFKTVRPSLHNRWLENMVIFIVLRDLQPAYLLPHITSGRLTTQKIRALYNILCARWSRALVQPGEKVGVIAAQSLGQLAMQATLNTF